jgi:hypothetical protein
MANTDELWELLEQAVGGCSYCEPFPEAEAALDELQERYSGECVWTRSHPYAAFWDTGCGRISLRAVGWCEEGEPGNVPADYCPFCGKLIVEKESDA